MVSRWCRDGGMACIAGDFCFVCKAGMGVGIAASFRIFVGCRDVAAGLEFECLPGKRTTGRHELSLLALNLTALMLGTSAAFCISVLLFFPYLWLWGDWHMFPINALSVLLPPLLVNLGFRHWVSRLPANIFIFIFLNGFWAAAVGMVFTGVVLVGLLDWADVFDTAVLWKTAFPVFFLIAWAEAFLSGISTAIFIALKPQWICTFDDGRYLKSAPKIWQ